ncbi:MAG: PAS domain S-box protein [Deltaproteobacteria bacterium]|nr:PAS domain S-box protein [Deltaproteobacteria bacterium]
MLHYVRRGRAVLRSLRGRLLLLMLAAFVPAAVVSLFAAYEYQRDAYRDSRADTLALVRLAARDHEEILFRTTPPLLQTLAELYPEVRAGDAARTSALFARVLSAYPQYNNLMACRVPSGDVFALGIPARGALNLSDRPYFRRVLETRAYTVGEFAIGKSSGKPTIVCAQPVFDGRGAVCAVLTAGLNLEYFGRQLERSEAAIGLDITFFDRNGVVMMAPASRRSWVGRDVSDSTLWRRMENEKSEGVFRGPDVYGTPTVIAFTPLSDPAGRLDGYVAASIPEGVAFARVERFLWQSGIGFAASLLVFLLGLVLIGRRSIVKGVDSLVAAAEHLAGGDLGTRTGDVGDTEEFVRLAHAFDAMAESLRERDEGQREAERALFKEKEHLAVTLRSIGDGVITTDARGRIVLLNAMAEALTGWSQDEATGRPLEEVFQIVAGKTGVPCPDPVARVLETGAVLALTADTVLVARDGSTRIIADSAAPIRGSDGLVVGVVLVFRDVTDQRRAEEALRDSEERYRSLVENVDLGIALVDDRHRLLMANAAHARIVKHDTPEGVGGECFRVLYARDSACPECPGTVAMATGQPASRENAGVRPDGTSSWIRVQAFPIRAPDGTSRGFIEVLEDLTDAKRAQDEQKRLEKKMLQAQKLESLGVLAGGIAHDFNNLLVGILGNADLALAKSSPESPVRSYLQRIDDAAQRAADLTNQMLAYSGRGRFVVEPIDLSRLVGEMEHLLATVVAKTATVRYDLASDLPPVEADATQLRQVVMNLITNGSDALGDREGTITVSTGLGTVEEARRAASLFGEPLSAARCVWVEVADTGCGMDRETRARIFDPFFTTKERGRGLGLAAALGIVRGHHGALAVSGEPGRGTTVRVYLPSCAETPKEVSADPETAAGIPALSSDQPATILVVDDEESVRTVATAILEEQGFRVLTASDGVEGVEVFRAHAGEVTAVLLDLTMPRLSGEDALREMRAIRADVAVLLSSGYDEGDAAGRFTGQGAAGFIQKPYRVATLLDTLARVVGTVAR